MVSRRTHGVSHTLLLLFATFVIIATMMSFSAEAQTNLRYSRYKALSSANNQYGMCAVEL